LEKIIKKEMIPMLLLEETKISGKKLIHKEQEYEFDKVINCSLRVATLPETMSLELEAGFIKVNEYFQTSIPNIYAVGDVNGLSFLAHSASAQGLAAINHINGVAQGTDILMHPLNIYTEPEIAHIGKSEEQLQAEGIEYKVSEYSFSANGKALIEGKTEGSVRLLHETKYNQVLGAQIVGSDATDLISEASILMELEGTIFDVARAVHAHPTISEVFMEAGSAGLPGLESDS
jgi:dihydrolipoamide dehydrogenase